MKYSTSRWVGRSWLVIAAALTSACADNAPLAPGDATTARRVAAAADVSNGNRRPDLPDGCEKLGAPPGSTLLLHAFGIGVQIYTWNGSSWGTAVPSATLYADEAGHGKVADHFRGPSWKSNSGSTVVGTVAERCTPDAASIAFLSLNAVSDDAPGLFRSVNFIQRLNTVGGNAPSTPGTLGQVAEIPYTADYLFYRTP